VIVTNREPRSKRHVADEGPAIEPSLALLSDTYGRPNKVNVLIIATGTMACAVVPSLLEAIREVS
jgi:hypothetical protein